MSADDYRLIRRHPAGGYAVVIGFASHGDLPEVAGSSDSFESIEDALVAAADEYPEYGVDIHPECFEGLAETVTPKAYTELGQWAFSHGETQEFEANWATDGLTSLAEVIGEAFHNADTERYLLTSNSGVAAYENDLFAMRSYCWCDGDIPGHEMACPPNFEHKPSGLRISWYKHAGRGITANQPQPAAIQWWRILSECVESIYTKDT